MKWQKLSILLKKDKRYIEQYIINALINYSKDKKLAGDVNLKDIAGDTAGFTGAELSNILNEAAIIATVNRHDEITRQDLDDAVKKVTVGLQKSQLINRAFTIPWQMVALVPNPRYWS